MDTEALDALLAERFDGAAGERAAVVRHARDLADAGRYERDTDRRLTAPLVADELEDAPDGGPASRWNWWLGALELAHGTGYGEFQVRRYAASDGREHAARTGRPDERGSGDANDTAD